MLLAGLIGCTEEAAQTPAPQPQKRVSPAPQPQAASPAAEQVTEKKTPEFSYRTEGRRDPFVPLSMIRRPVASGPVEPETPLQRYDVSQYRLTGVIVGKGESKAMVVAPDGKSYILSTGVKIGKNNGVVVEITSDSVRVKEKYYDFSGNIIENLQEIVVPRREGV
jgi:type IV pilus assembly protein PilP